MRHPAAKQAFTFMAALLLFVAVAALLSMAQNSAAKPKPAISTPARNPKKARAGGLATAAVKGVADEATGAATAPAKALVGLLGKKH